MSPRLTARQWERAGAAIVPSPASIANRGARTSKVSVVIHQREAVGFTFVNTRRMRLPFVGRVGKASTWSRSLRARRESGRPRSSTGRKLAKSSFHSDAYQGNSSVSTRVACREYARRIRRTASSSPPLARPFTRSSGTIGDVLVVGGRGLAHARQRGALAGIGQREGRALEEEDVSLLQPLRVPAAPAFVQGGRPAGARPILRYRNEPLGHRALLLALDLRPGVPQWHGAVEHEAPRGRVPEVGAEVAVALELVAAAGRGVGEARLEPAPGEPLE